MTAQTSVDRLYEEAKSILSRLGEDQPSLSISASDNFRKALLLGTASYFEHRLTSCVVQFVHNQSNGSNLVVSFLKNKAIDRQYHSWFDWKASNANQFFGLFGSDFKQAMGVKLKEEEGLQSAVKAFLELGNERNKLVHQDFASFALEKTLDEIYAEYKVALKFVDELPKQLAEIQAGLKEKRTQSAQST